MKSSQVVNTILSQIKKVTGPFSVHKPVVLHEPHLKYTKASDYLNDCLNNGWVSWMD